MFLCILVLAICRYFFLIHKLYSPAFTLNSGKKVDGRGRISKLCTRRKHIDHVVMRPIYSTPTSPHKYFPLPLFLTASVEAVVKFGLRQHAFTIFDENSTLALCRRIAKLCPAAQQTLDRMDFHQHAMIWQSGTKMSTQQVALRDPLALVRQKFAINGATNGNSLSSFGSSATSGTWRNSLPLRVRNGNVVSKKSNVYRNGVGDTSYMKFSPNTTNVDPRLKNFWIRVALLEKVLDKILLFLTKNASRYYEKHAILADPCDGLLLADLLRGPCAIDYSRTRTTDHLFTDPPVSELIQRHGISGSLMSRELTYVPPSYQSWQVTNRNLRATSIPNLSVNKENGSDLDVMETESHDGRLHVCEDSPRRSTPEPSQDLSRTSSVLSLSQATEVSSTASLILETEHAGFSVPESLRVSRRNLASAAREHVESMHQSIRSMLVYGKNNIRVQTKDNDSPLPGYLSIHDHGKDLGIFVSWTPNWAMASDASTPSLSESWSRNCESAQRQPRLDTRCMQPNSALLDGYREAYWGYAIRIKLVDLVYIHCHESAEYSSAVFVTKEGISLTPLLFSAKSHLDTFLHCLDQAIRKHHGHLEPPPVTDMVNESYSRCEDQPVPNSFEKSPSRTLRLPSFFMSNSEYPNTEVNRNSFGFWSFTGDSTFSKLSEPKTRQTSVSPDQMINLHVTSVHESSPSSQSSPEEANVPTVKDTSRMSRTFRIVFSNPKHKKVRCFR
ncbi:hypothetical protein PHET_04552 [Paragonimus heterotremus]|uniref:RUN domain-containing protein n=1 Tax=Paragonimus heterotremus TaxID=100268 RepID=A0A8J4WHC9_9TREM|nr:hypothetical protein PHET_04552 [Paragonimus heterotremus]